MRSAPLGNREIAFGCVRLAIRRPCTGPLGWRARSSPRLARARGGFRRASTPPPRIRLHPRGAIHPPLRRAWLGREASLRQSHPSRRRLAPRGAGFALAPWQARLAPCALSALVRFCGARSAPLTVSKVSALVRNCAESSPFTLSRANDGRSGQEGRRHEAEAVTAGDADGGKRDAADPATGGIPTEPGDGRPRRMRTRHPAGIRRSRRCAAPTATLWLSADRMCWAGNAAAFSRARLGRRDDWRWTRPRRQSGDCRAGRGRSQAPSATGG